MISWWRRLLVLLRCRTLNHHLEPPSVCQLPSTPLSRLLQLDKELQKRTARPEVLSGPQARPQSIKTCRLAQASKGPAGCARLPTDRRQCRLHSPFILAKNSRGAPAAPSPLFNCLVQQLGRHVGRGQQSWSNPAPRHVPHHPPSHPARGLPPPPAHLPTCAATDQPQVTKPGNVLVDRG